MQLTPLKDKSSIAVYYKNMDIEVSEEVLLYDFNALVAAVGGSLGLFLGFSCYSVALELWLKSRQYSRNLFSFLKFSKNVGK